MTEIVEEKDLNERPVFKIESGIKTEERIKSLINFDDCSEQN